MAQRVLLELLSKLAQGQAGLTLLLRCCPDGVLQVRSVAATQHLAAAAQPSAAAAAGWCVAVAAACEPRTFW
jgi:hypothetical protein